MKEIDEIRTAEYLKRASPETVYEWLKAYPRREPEEDFFFGRIPEIIEQKLLVRRDEIIDLALAAWSTHDATIDILYNRWCARSVSTDWPPQCSTYSYAILVSILANVNADLLILKGLNKENSVASMGDFDWLIEHCDTERFGLLRAMHGNPSLGRELLLRCAKKSGAYRRIDDNRWLNCLWMLGRNKHLNRKDTSDNEGPDLRHSDIHEAIVTAAAICPKTTHGAEKMADFLGYLPTSASDGAFINDGKLNAAVQAWDIEIINDAKEDKFSESDIMRRWDGMTASERVQFHLLRHYCSYLHLDPNDPLRARRLAAYSKNPVNGGQDFGPGYKGRLSDCNGKGLDIEAFQRYSDRDGPAFMYANSLNENIWRDAESSAFENSWKEPKPNFSYPEDKSEMRKNREACFKRVAATQSIKPKDVIEELTAMETKTNGAIEALRTELGQSHSYLLAKIGNLKKWLIWGGIIVASLVLLQN